MEESLRALIEGALAAQKRADIAFETLRAAERARDEAVSQLRTEVANLDHAIGSRIAIYGDNVVRLAMIDVNGTGIRSVMLIPLVQVLKAAPPEKPVEPLPVAPKQPATPPSSGGAVSKFAKR